MEERFKNLSVDIQFYSVILFYIIRKDLKTYQLIFNFGNKNDLVEYCQFKNLSVDIQWS